MATNHRLVQTKQLRTGYLSPLFANDSLQPYYDYDGFFDGFTLLFAEADADDVIVAHPLDNNVSLLYRAADKEILGILLEAIRHNLQHGIPNATADWRMSDYGLRLTNDGDIRLRVLPIGEDGNFTVDVRVYDAEDQEQQALLLQAA